MIDVDRIHDAGGKGQARTGGQIFAVFDEHMAEALAAAGRDGAPAALRELGMTKCADMIEAWGKEA